MNAKIKGVRKRLVKSAKTNSKRIHITHRTDGWAVRKEGNLQASRVVDTQHEAIAIAREWVKNGSASVVVVHSKSGKFRVAK